MFYGVFLTDISGGLQSQGASILGNVSNSRMVIFDENKISNDDLLEPKLESWVAPPTAKAKENERRPERWCDVKVRDKQVLLVDPNVSNVTK